MGCAFTKYEEEDVMDSEGNKMETQRGGTSRKTTADAAAAATITVPPEAASAADAFVDEDGELFFDAVERFSETVAAMDYAPASTMRKRGVSLLLPQSLLSDSATSKRSVNLMGTTNQNQNREDSSNTATVTTTVAPPPSTTTTTAQTPTSTSSDVKKGRDSIAVVKEHLLSQQYGGVGGLRGYPGELSDDELAACLEFRKLLKAHAEPAYQQMVLAYGPHEDEAFALCRFLRSRDFSPQAVMAMLEDNGAANIWKEAASHDFYSDFHSIYGCPNPVFMALFPVVVSGLAKNGATVFYFKTGNMNVDALECIADLPELVPAIWDLLHTKGKLSMEREAKTHDALTTTVLCERIILVDMKNYPGALFSSRGIEWMKQSAAITACFPETMNRSYMVNVPRSFSIVWALVKIFIEARTLAKIGFFANADKAKKDLEQFVDSHELLSDYGGKGPSYDDVLASQQKELGKGCTRFVVNHIMVAGGKKEAQSNFEVQPDEKVHSIVVYTKSNQCSQFTIKHNNKILGGTPTKVERKQATHHGKSNHYSVDLNPPSLPSEPGTFTIVATAPLKDHFVVAVSLCPK